MAPAFTARQGEYLTFIHRYTEKFGVAPSFEDVGNHFGTTPPSVNNMIKTLCARGLLSKLPGVARSMRVLVPASRNCGRIALHPRRSSCGVQPERESCARSSILAGG